MSDFLQKIESWYDAVKTAGASYRRRGVRPMSDWKMILISTFVVICFGAIFEFYFYTQISKGALFIVEKNESQKEVKIDSSLLQKVADGVRLREATLDKIKQDKMIPADPSL